ncbi:MAG: CoA transferase [Syntrophales bacterium]|jgi:crotonobetainyl-CoA:carnitine CoA-transferase CaiB-like acyl-CoA transferase|nr:CoA transferase [Syntrophales bacterium]MDY0045306.1 CoA transferase [Syntrophales bacterium]
MSMFKRKSKERVYTRYSTAGGGVSRWKETVEKLMTPEGRPEVLKDVLILDASSANFSGIIAASLFAEFGAEVIKIEPAEGDPCRKMTPFGTHVNGTGIPFIMEGRNKKYMTLDLENSPDDREIFAKLAQKASVVIETYPAGLMDSWGIGYRQLSVQNPGLIYIAVTAYGQYTEKAKNFVNFPDTDITTQTGSGLSAQIGDLPTEPEPYNWPLKAGMWMGWYISGISAALGGMMAIIHRRKTGEGQIIDIAGMDAYSSMTGFPATIGFTWEKSRPRIGVLDFILYPYGHWKCKDGLVAIAAPRDHDFRALLKILGRWDLEDDFKYTPDRIPDIIDMAMELHREIEKETMKYTADELTAKALTYAMKAAKSKWRGGGVPIVMRVMSPENTMQNKQWEIRKSFKKIEDERIGKFMITSGFVKMTESPPQVKWVAVEIGKDNEYVKSKYL